MFTVLLSSAEGAISLLIVCWRAVCHEICFYVAVHFLLMIVSCECPKGSLKNHRSRVSHRCCSVTVLEKDIYHLMCCTMSCYVADHLKQNVFQSLCIFTMLGCVNITPYTLAKLTQRSSLTEAMQTSTWLCAWMTLQSDCRVLLRHTMTQYMTQRGTCSVEERVHLYWVTQIISMSWCDQSHVHHNLS